MCGIAGAYAYAPVAPPVETWEVAVACDRMTCRGPDGSASWRSTDGRVALAHRRLAIIDLSESAAQPMIDVDTDNVISFNGEIYNYKSLRAELEAKGHRFRTTSDTEVLLKLYLQDGQEMVHRLRGMFAFAIWDGRRGGMFLARDHFGIKPLYYTDDGRTLRAASEVKALIATGLVDTEIEPAGHVGFFLWGHVPEPYSLYKRVLALPAGHTMWVDPNGRSEPRCYASISELLAHAASESSHSSRVEDTREYLREVLRDTVAHHMVADVDVGVFLSAGLDSTSIAALAAERSERLRTVTLAFEEFRGHPEDESTLAEEVAKRYGTNHRTVWVSREDFEHELERIVDRMDQPTTDGVNSYFVARAAAEAGLKVALSGLGGDELFGGYAGFTEIPRLVSAVSRVPASGLVGRGVRVLTAPALRRLTSPKYAAVLEYGGDVAGAYLLRRALFLPWELSNFLDADLVREGLETLDTLPRLRATINAIEHPRLQISALESSWYMRNQLLRDTDWASMSHSVEVRVPLVDWSLWRSLSPKLLMLGNRGKREMALTPSLPLPSAVLNRRKTGFGVPTQRWIREAGHEGNRERGLRGWARYVYDRVATDMSSLGNVTQSREPLRVAAGAVDRIAL